MPKRHASSAHSHIHSRLACNNRSTKKVRVRETEPHPFAGFLGHVVNVARCRNGTQGFFISLSDVPVVESAVEKAKPFSARVVWLGLNVRSPAHFLKHLEQLRRVMGTNCFIRPRRFRSNPCVKTN